MQIPAIAAELMVRALFLPRVFTQYCSICKVCDDKNALELLRDTMQDKNDRFRRPHAQRDGCSVVRLTESNS
jgi:hypothetical protein